MTEAPLSSETLSIPLGGLTEAEVRFHFGGGELAIGRAEPGTLVSGSFEGGVLTKSTEPGKIELEPVDPTRHLLAGCTYHWNVALTSEIPVDLRFDTGANRSIIDLEPIRVRRLELHTGASDTTIRLPASGETTVRVECGFAQVVLEVPSGVSARIHGKVALGATQVDENRFRKAADGWESPNYETAANRVEIDVSGGFGSVQIH